MRFGIGSKNTVFRWTKQLGPCKTRNKPATKIDMNDALASDVKLYPDAYRHGRAGRLGVSEGCIQSALRRLKISREKNTRHPKAGSKSRQDFENKVKNHQGAIRQPSILTEAASRMTCPAPTVAHLLANAALANTVGAPKDEPMPLVRYWPVVC